MGTQQVLVGLAVATPSDRFVPTCSPRWFVAGQRRRWHATQCTVWARGTKRSLSRGFKRSQSERFKSRISSAGRASRSRAISSSASCSLPFSRFTGTA